MKPSRGLLRPARCAVALVQLAAPTGGLMQATEAADIKRALRRWARAAGVRGEGRRSPANRNRNPKPKPKPKPAETSRSRSRSLSLSLSLSLSRSRSRSRSLTHPSVLERTSASRSGGVAHGARAAQHLPTRAGRRCVPCRIFSDLPMLGRGTLWGGPPRRAGARRRRVVSLGRACRRRPQFTRVGRCRRGVGGGGGSQPSMGRTFLSLA